MCSMEKPACNKYPLLLFTQAKSCIAVIVMVVCHYCRMFFMAVTVRIVSDMFESYAYNHVNP